jgi:hypothetical protein
MTNDHDTRKLKTLYARALRQEQIMKSYGQTDRYYVELEELQLILKAMLALDWIELPKPSLVAFLSLCVAYRPTEPVWVLTSLRSQLNKKEGKE